MTVLMIVIFLVGYILITIEHSININKAAVALCIGSVLWIIYMFISPELVPLVSTEAFHHYIANHPYLADADLTEQVHSFVVNYQILEGLGDISETILFLMSAMIIVEFIDSHGGFTVISDHITTKDKRRLLWLIAFLTFFMSAVLDNLTTTIIMIMLLRKLLPDVKERWLFGSIVVLAANSGGAWSPIGDVTTIMLWIKGNVTVKVVPSLILPSLVSVIIPTWIAQRYVKGGVQDKKHISDTEHHSINEIFQMKERLRILLLGVGFLVLTPVFKIITHLPPFIWLLLSVSLLWIYSEVIYNKKNQIHEDLKLRLIKVLGRLDFATILFFLGILFAVDALKSAGILSELSGQLAKYMPNIYAQGVFIGILSSIVDNVPLVAAAIGMYPVVELSQLSTASNPEFLQNFVTDGTFWHLLAYCAGVGGSILIVGSAAGVVLMGLERVSFGWYLKRISLLVFVGYIAGVGVYILQNMLVQ